MSAAVAVRTEISVAESPLARRFGRWAVVTGASSGIGRALAERLADAGFDVVLVGRNAQALDAAAAVVRQRHRDAEVVEADLGTPAGLHAVIAATAQLDVGVFVANAGFGTSGPFAASRPPDEVAMLDVNCRALLVHTQHFAARFSAQSRGCLVLVSSMLARQGTPWVAHYAATKAYVSALGEALRVELAPHGVEVHVAEPGPTATRFAERARMTFGAAMTPDDVARAMVGRLGRGGGRYLPGGLSKLLVWSQAMLPHGLRVRLMGMIMRGMAAPSA